jgi:colanic acid/amylovoran biosynthesis glycosyltransferase
VRVWYILTRFPAPRETFAVTDIKALLRAGVDVSVHCLRSPHPRWEALWKEHQLGQLKVTHNSARSVFRGLIQAVGRPRLLAALVWFSLRHHWRRPVHAAKSLALVPRALDLFACAGEDRPDVIHLFWGHYPSLFGFLVKREWPGQVLTMFLGAYDLTEEYRGSAIAALMADTVFTHTAVNTRMLVGRGVPHEKIRVVYRGIDGRSLTGPRPRPEKVRFRVVTAGALEERKGIGDAIAAFALVQERAPDASLVIMGDGSRRGAFEAQVGAAGLRNVAFAGHVRHAQVLETMSAAEVFLFLSKSRAERLPNVVKEAMASDCLCVVSDTPGIDELVTSGVHGVVVPIDDPAAAAEGVLRAWQDSDWARECRRRAREHLRVHFDVDVSMKRYVEVWREHLGISPADERAAVGADLPSEEL